MLFCKGKAFFNIIYILAVCLALPFRGAPARTLRPNGLESVCFFNFLCGHQVMLLCKRKTSINIRRVVAIRAAFCLILTVSEFSDRKHNIVFACCKNTSRNPEDDNKNKKENKSLGITHNKLLKWISITSLKRVSALEGVGINILKRIYLGDKGAWIFEQLTSQALFIFFQRSYLGSGLLQYQKIVQSCCNDDNDASSNKDIL